MPLGRNASTNIKELYKDNDNQGFVLDGYSRTLRQVQSFDPGSLAQKKLNPLKP